MKTWGRIAVALAIAVLLSLQLWQCWRTPATAPSTISVDCHNLQQACQLDVQGQTVSVHTTPQASQLKPFVLTVQGLQGRWTARFGMQGMDMGPIAFPLQPAADGSLQANAMLPYCVQGRRDWLLWLEGDGGRVELKFTSAI